MEEKYFNPRPPRGGRPRVSPSTEVRKISIHAPREGGDLSPVVTAPEEVTFQSTPPARGATTTAEPEAAEQVISIHAPREGGDEKFDSIENGYNQISIHAPREGGDRPTMRCLRPLKNFNPRPPRGGRRTQGA